MKSSRFVSTGRPLATLRRAAFFPMLLSIYMCGRYTLTIDKSTIEKRFGAKFYIAKASYDYEATYNAAPSQMLPIIRTYHSDRIELATWGFWPENWKRSKKICPQINARLETADERPMFHDSFRGRHCLVLADGYYEWKTLPNGTKQPYRITLKTGEPFAMAGIYARQPTEYDTAEKNPVNFAILTTKGNDAVRHIHDRMPVILDPDSYDLWLDPGMQNVAATSELLKPYNTRLMRCYPVSNRVNHVANDDEACSAPVELAQIQDGLFS